MDENEVRKIIKKVEQEKIELHKRNGMWIEPVRHFNHHKRLMTIGDQWKKIRVLVFAGMIMMMLEYFFDAHNKVLDVFTDRPHAHLQVPDIPEIDHNLEIPDERTDSNGWGRDSD